MVSTDQTYPAWSAHQVTLTVPNIEPLIVQVAWPFLVKGIKLSIIQLKKRKKGLHLVLEKCLNDPLPKEFGGRSKWDPDRLKPWRDLASNGTLKMHIEAQFLCRYLQNSGFKKEILESSAMKSTTLDHVREIVRALFYGHYYNSFYLFAIYDEKEELMFHLRVQPPVRFTPQGSPLLLVSVIDHQLARQLIADEKLNAEENQHEFHRIITQGVSREVCAIRTSSAKEMNLFRYSLRLNMTRMRRGAWQSKNLPRGENSPWMPTFVSPLYDVRTQHGSCSEKVVNHFEKGFGKGFIIDVFLGDSMCANCSVRKIPLKRCKGCKATSYCSVSCQKNHWIIHHKKTCKTLKLFKRYNSD